MNVQMRYRYRIGPTPAQQRMLARVFGCARVVFNDALRVRDKAYRDGIKLSDCEIQRRVITQAKKTTERSWLAEVPSVALVWALDSAVDVFEHDVDASIRLPANVVDRDDRRVPQLGDHPCLAKQKLHVVRRTENLRARHLDRHGTLEVFVPRKIDPSEPSLTELSDH